MIHHIDFAVTDFEKSRTFYVRALAPLGLQLVMERPFVTGFGQLPDPVFWIRRGLPLDEPREATVASFLRRQEHTHVAFVAPTREAVDAFHREAIAAGGTDNGAPGLRPQYADDYYAAFVFDPDGHNIEAVCRVAAANTQ